jgi:hypothetical protein
MDGQGGIGRGYRLTLYDAACLELAQRRKLPLATLDKDLIRVGKALSITLLVKRVESGRSRFSSWLYNSRWRGGGRMANLITIDQCSLARSHPVHRYRRSSGITSSTSQHSPKLMSIKVFEKSSNTI